MGWLSVLISVLAAILFFTLGKMVLMILAILVAIGCYWSYGIMHNYAFKTASKRLDFSGKFYDIELEEAQSVPDWIAWINLFATIIGLVLLVVSIVMIL